MLRRCVRFGVLFSGIKLTVSCILAADVPTNACGRCISDSYTPRSFGPLVRCQAAYSAPSE